MTRYKVKPPHGDTFFVVRYNDKYGKELLQYSADQYERIQHALTAAAKNYLSGDDADSYCWCTISNHSGELVITPAIEDAEEANDILDGNSYEFHWFESEK